MRGKTFAPLALAFGLAAAVVLSAAPAAAKVLLSVEEALALVFPGCTIERGTVYLAAEEVERAHELAGTEPASAVVHPYRAVRPDARSPLCGTAYLDSHRVRTLAETVMVAIDPAGAIVRVEVLSFDEPPDYLPRRQWYAQFDGRALAAETELGRAIRPVTGATLTARATTDAARRALALHRLLAERAGALAAAAAAAPAAPAAPSAPVEPEP